MTKTKIALIEDNVAIQEMYKFRLEFAGFEVRTASNGRAGLELIKQFHPQLILVDILMPVMNGDEMIQKLRATDLGADMKVLVLTNISKTEAPKQLQFLHIDRYVVKAHHTPQQVTAIVHEVLGTPAKAV